MGKMANFLSVFFLWILIASISYAGISEAKEILSVWPASPLKINGSDEEWGKEAVYFEKKIKVNYAFQNDENNLYILFKFNDPSYLSSIDKTGITIWFDKEKRKKKDCGITFLKKKIPTEIFLSLLEQQRGAITEEDREQLSKEPYHFIYQKQVINKKASSSKIVENRESPPALFMSTSTKEEVVYEFVIPMESDGDFAANTGLKPGQVIKVGFEWGGLTEEMKRERIKKIEEMTEKKGIPEARIEQTLRMERVLDTDFNKSSQEPKKYALWVDVRLAMKNKG
jgi:hypothetical protein